MAQISFAVSAKLIIAFVFTTWIVQFFYFVNQKFLASSLFFACTARFESDLPVNHTLGFSSRDSILYTSNGYFLFFSNFLNTKTILNDTKRQLTWPHVTSHESFFFFSFFFFFFFFFFQKQLNYSFDQRIS